MASDSPTAPSANGLKPTAEKLVQAAAAEFNAHGFGGTDTNRIARRAGFAPQTFYRWFKDKTEVFIEVYRLWQQQEGALLRALLAESASDARLVEATVAHHRAYLVFRRSLRQLSLENAEVRAVRARSRLNQIAQIRRWGGGEGREDSDLAATILQLERLADALAEGEFLDMGLDATAGEATLALLIHRLRTSS